MSNLVCKNCKSTAVEYEDYCGGTSYYRCKTCGQRGDKDKFTQQTVFHRITASPEVLAEKLVYRITIIGGCEFMYSSGVLDCCYYSREKAIRATVKKLKEVVK